MSIFSALAELIENARYNRNLYKTGQANQSVKVSTTIGWRPDPINGQDGMTERINEHGDVEYNRVASRPAPQAAKQPAIERLPHAKRVPVKQGR